MSLALTALHLPAHRHLANLASELRDPGPDPAPVRLDLGLTRTAGADPATASYPATSLPGQRFPPATQARQQILHLRQFDLRLAFLALGVLGEDIQDQGGAIDHLDLAPA